jgi:hypothetical protein
MRTDLTDDVIHFIRLGWEEEEPYQTLQKILRERRLLGGNGFIRGGYRCVCFTELSPALLRTGFVNQRDATRYSEFGIRVPKDWLFAKGGRPVIYQPEDSWANSPRCIGSSFPGD